uniref:hypothetical protein n=1 Tax=Microbispora cellulosiformans TaxID=2614688 RepID=UPI00177B9E31|nr:hypothetical protein [Microbispora cellulosiformans]
MIGRAYIRAASSAAASLALATLAVVVISPMLGATADPVNPCDASQGDDCDVVTVTVTQTPSPSPSPTAEPVVTKTVTVTPTPKRTTRKPQATHTTTPPASTGGQQGQQGQQPPATTEQFPSTTTEVPAGAGGTSATPTPETEGQVSLPPASAPETTPTPTAAASFEEPAPDTVPYEIRNASPEYDKASLAHRLAIPAGVLLGIALIAWLIFEGRLRRMAHAAAVRRGGPAVATPVVPETPAAYPAGSGYAPMVGFMPVPYGQQPYPQQYAVPYPQQPYGYAVPYGYAQPYGYPAGDPAQGQAPAQAQQGGVPDPWSTAVGEPQQRPGEAPDAQPRQ